MLNFHFENMLNIFMETYIKKKKKKRNVQSKCIWTHTHTRTRTRTHIYIYIYIYISIINETTEDTLNKKMKSIIKKE